MLPRIQQLKRMIKVNRQRQKQQWMKIQLMLRKVRMMEQQKSQRKKRIQ